MAYGPLIYAYVLTLSGLTIGRRIYLHLIPLGVQVAYYLILLLLPKHSSHEWIQNIHFPWIDYLLAVLVTFSMSVYLYASYRRLINFNRQLEQQRSDSEAFRFPWITRFLILNTVSLTTLCVFLILGLWYPFSYDEHFWLFSIQSLLLLYLSFESWKFGDIQVPLLRDISQCHIHLDQSEHEKALSWQKLIQESAWWKHPEFSLKDLANQLGSNTSTVSQILNKGLGKNFNTLINEMRVNSICETLRSGLEGRSILEIAFSKGFNSKNSFNRNFKNIVGLTPSEYLNSQVPNHKSLKYVKNGANS
ncbi:helix-turn-helix domain-containing protein [Marinicella sp. W31]|uniref:helix-turn-helix domain-containing protein n=1 Tax=Marinicella sp. W31 TaxID=3023713 RepID=UPI003757C6DE